MVALKHLILVAPALVIILLLASCGGTAKSTPSPAPAKTPAATQTATMSSVVVKTTTLTVGGKTITVLTNAQGKTLYYFMLDTSQKTACTGSCTHTWPPLLVSGTTKVSAATKLPGVLEVYKNANGNQVIYNDHPLYTFSGDSGPGQSNGEGIADKWFVVTPTIAKNK